MCFPLVIRYINKQFNKKYLLYFSTTVLIVFQIIIAIIGSSIAEYYNDISLLKWFVYFFPLSRTLDFLVGCCMGALFIKEHSNKIHKESSVLHSFFEIGIISLVIVSLYIYENSIGLLGSQAIKYTLLFEFTTIPLLWLIAKEKGIICKVFTLSFLKKLGDLSPYTFLTHLACIKYSNLILYKLFPNMNKYIPCLVAFILTIVSAKLWVMLQSKFKNSTYF